MVFSERNKLALMFAEWCEKNNITICSVNCITFLEMKGLLDVKKVKEVLKDEKNNK